MFPIQQQNLGTGFHDSGWLQDGKEGLDELTEGIAGDSCGSEAGRGGHVETLRDQLRRIMMLVLVGQGGRLFYSTRLASDWVRSLRDKLLPHLEMPH